MAQQIPVPESGATIKRKTDQKTFYLGPGSLYDPSMYDIVSSTQTPVPTPVPTPTPAATPAATPTAAPASTYTGVSIVDYLKSVGQTSDYASRATLAAQKGIANYTGTAAQNTQLLELLKSGSKTSVLPITATSEEARTAEEKLETDKTSEFVEKLNTQNQQIQTLTNAQRIAALQSDLRSLGLEVDLTSGAVTKAPALPTYESDFEALRAEHGLEAIESRINQLKTSTRDIEASLTAGMYDEEGKLRPMELIGTRQRELQRQAQEQLDTINRSLSTLTDEYNTKVNLINTTMSLKQMDYNTAKEAYDTNFNRAISILNYIEGKATQEQQEATAQRDDARANLTLLSNLVAGSGKTWDQLDLNTQATIHNLEIQGQLPYGIYQAYLEQEPKAELLGTFTGYDASGSQIISFIYKDEDGMPGIMKTVSTGIIKEPSSEDTRDAQWAAVEKLIADNPGASYDELFPIAQRYATKLADADLKTIFQSKGVKTPARTEEEQSVTRQVDKFKKDWQEGGEKKAGTRDELIDELWKTAKHLTYNEIKIAVEKLLPDDWLESYKPSWWR